MAHLLGHSLIHSENPLQPPRLISNNSYVSPALLEQLCKISLILETSHEEHVVSSFLYG